MITRSAVSALFFVLLVAADFSGCTNHEAPFSPTAPGTTTPSGDANLVGAWYAVGSNGGFQFARGGALYYLTVDDQNRLQVDAEDAPGQWVVPQAGHCIFTWIYLTGPSQSQVNTGVLTTSCSYMFMNNDSTMILKYDSSAEAGTTYLRKTIGDVIR